MIRKLGNIVIVILLIAATGGIPVTRHYCGSSAMSFSIFSIPEPCCDEPCGNCRNVFHFFKVHADFEAVSLLSPSPISSVVILFPFPFISLRSDLTAHSRLSTFTRASVHDFSAGLSPACLGNFRC